MKWYFWALVIVVIVVLILWIQKSRFDNCINDVIDNGRSHKDCNGKGFYLTTDKKTAIDIKIFPFSATIVDNKLIK